MEPTWQNAIAQECDKVLMAVLYGLSSIIPNFGNYGFSDYVAYGFNISGDALLTAAARAFAFLLPLFIAGYFFLRTREVAK